MISRVTLKRVRECISNVLTEENFNKKEYFLHAKKAGKERINIKYIAYVEKQI